MSGTLHDAPLGDDAVAVSKAARVVISRPHVTLTMSADPASGLAPLAVSYTFLAANDSAIDPSPGAVEPGVGDPGISGSACAGAVTLTGGDADGDALLDPGETWRYACRSVFGAGTFDTTATFTGSSTVDGRPWPPATAHRTVTATRPVAAPAPTPIATPTPIPQDDERPRLRLLALSPTRFRAASSGPSIASKERKRASEVTFSLSEAAKLRFTVERKRSGRKVRKRCVAARHANGGRRACTRWARRRGSFGMSSKAGRHRFRFSGRLAGKRLPPGPPSLRTGRRTAPPRRASGSASPGTDLRGARGQIDYVALLERA